VNSSNIDVAAVSVKDVREAASRLKPYVHRTPLLSNHSLSEAIGAEVRLKCENLQRAGSFKIRGAMNALLKRNGKTVSWPSPQATMPREWPWPPGSSA
jgi:threonine dehydratase